MMKQAAYISLLFASPGMAQTATVIMITVQSSNGNSTGVVATPSRTQNGNFGTGCVSNVIQPTGVPVGQLYATSAIATAAIAAGCATQSFPTVTASGTGIAAVGNGNGAGGTDSATAITDTYGGTAEDSVCSGDPHNADVLLYGLPTPSCTANGTAQFGESTAPSFGNADMLWLSFYGSNSTTLDSITNYVDDVYFMPTSLSTLHDLENDVGIVSSPNSYLGSSKANVVWGTHWSSTAGMWQYCPQQCSGWVTLKFCQVASPSTCITSYALTNNHAYHMIWYGTRGAVGSTYCYNYIKLYDVTAGTTPTLYTLWDSVTGIVPCGSPVNQPGWASGTYVQNQLDMLTANSSSAYYIINRTTTFFSLPNVVGAGSAFFWQIP